MVVNIEGTIYKTGTTKKGGHFFNMLVSRPDGQQDSICVFTDNANYKSGQKFKGAVNAFIQVVSEVK